ncbi:retrovirus-related pol polyprotein from transposon TNT 1-94 [Tanacetum coccineum]
MAKASPTQAWLCHRKLFHLNFDTINLLSKNDIVNGLPKLKYVKDHMCSSCELGKENRSTFKTKTVPSSKGRLNLLHMDLCGPMRIESINGKKYILVIVDDYSRYTWTHFLRSKDETPEVLKDILKMIQQNLQAQNGVVERRDRTLVKAVRTMLSASKLPLFFWAEAIATAYGENLDKIKEKGDPCILVGYRVYNKRTRLIVESIHINFDEIKELTMTRDDNTSGLAPQLQMTPDDNTSGLVPQLQMTSNHNSSELRIQDHNNKPSSSKLVLNFSPLADTTALSL